MIEGADLGGKTLDNTLLARQLRLTMIHVERQRQFRDAVRSCGIQPTHIRLLTKVACQARTIYQVDQAERRN